MKQISVFLENKPGALYELTKVLADNKVNLNVMSLSEAGDYGLVRMIPDDVFNATNVLKESGFIYKLVDVVAVAIADEPGALLEILDVLKNQDINVDYMYAYSADSNTAKIAIKTEDTKKAEAVLRGKGIKIAE